MNTTAEESSPITYDRRSAVHGLHFRLPRKPASGPGDRHGFEVYMLPHASDVSRWSARPGEERCGAVGVACLSTLVGGGWELKRYDVPAKCVLLNACGCKKHWHETGIETDIDMRELKRILEIDGAN